MTDRTLASAAADGVAWQDARRSFTPRPADSSFDDGDDADRQEPETNSWPARTAARFLDDHHARRLSERRTSQFLVIR